MDDLEGALRARLHAAGATVQGSAVGAARIRATVRRRTRRRRAALIGVPSGLVLIALVAGLLLALSGGTPQVRSTAPSGPPPAPSGALGQPAVQSPAPAAPGAPSTSGAGGTPFSPAYGASVWVTVAYGNAQISVPPGSTVAAAGCPSRDAPVTVFLGSPRAEFCPMETTGGTVVNIQPTGAARPSTSPSRRINGIVVFPAFGIPLSVEYSVPSLGVTVTGTGPLAQQVTSTLHRSPRAAALNLKAVRPPPESWHRVSFAGLSMAVPSGWPVERANVWQRGCAPGFTLADPSDGAVLAHPAVVLDADRSAVAASCPAMIGGWLVHDPVDGLVIAAPGPGLPGLAPANHCRRFAALKLCSVADAPYSVLDLAVTPKGGKTIGVEIGLAGDGSTARRILESLRAVGQ